MFKKINILNTFQQQIKNKKMLAFVCAIITEKYMNAAGCSLSCISYKINE